MHTENKRKLIDLASKQTNPIAGIVNKLVAEEEAILYQFVVKKLEEAGFTVRQRKLKILTSVDVFDGQDGLELVASGSSNTPYDALLHALLGYIREQK